LFCGGGGCGLSFQELIELHDESVHIHIVHQSPIFHSIEVDGETTAAAHLQITEELDSIRVGADYFIDSGIFLNNHENTQKDLPHSLGYVSIYGFWKQYFSLRIM